MEQTLLLNATYEPLKFVHWQNSVALWVQCKGEILSVYYLEVRSVSFSFRLPSVIRLLRRIRIRRKFDYVPFSRANIYARDHYTCQYCGRRGDRLTVDHVTPRSKGGDTTWTNVVAACLRCNLYKGNRAVDEAGMTLLRAPQHPQFLFSIHLLRHPHAQRQHLSQRQRPWSSSYLPHRSRSQRRHRPSSSWAARPWRCTAYPCC